MSSVSDALSEASFHSMALQGGSQAFLATWDTTGCALPSFSYGGVHVVSVKDTQQLDDEDRAIVKVAYDMNEVGKAKRAAFFYYGDKFRKAPPNFFGNEQGVPFSFWGYGLDGTDFARASKVVPRWFFVSVNCRHYAITGEQWFPPMTEVAEKVKEYVSKNACFVFECRELYDKKQAVVLKEKYGDKTFIEKAISEELEGLISYSFSLVASPDKSDVDERVTKLVFELLRMELEVLTNNRQETRPPLS